MHVVIVCDFGDVNGGAAKVAIDSAVGLAGTGIDVTYVSAVGPVSPLLDHPRIAARRIELESVWDRPNAIAAAAQGVWNRRARRGLEAILEPMPRDATIVHFHQWTKALSPSVLLAPRRYGLPAVVSLHDYFIACPNGAYYHFPEAAPCRLTPMSARCAIARCDRHGYRHKAIRLLRQGATRYALAQAGTSLSFLSVSSFADRIIGPFLPSRHARFVNRSPITVPREPPVAVADNREFLFVGRLAEEKGARLLANVAREAGLPLTVVGDGPLLAELQEFGDGIRCMGWRQGDEVAAIMSCARALVFPSTWYETGGLVVFEALARGIPVIVSRTTAPVEFIEHGENGFVIDAGDRTALLACMRSLEDDAVARRLGAEAYRRYWAAPQTTDVHTSNLLAVYRSLLHSANLGRPAKAA